MVEIPGYTLLGRVNTPADLRKLPVTDLPHLAVEMRRYLIETLGRIGGHFAANLGTVELTLAIHYAFNTPHDRLVWDVGHQAYPHKMITGHRYLAYHAFANETAVGRGRIPISQYDAAWAQMAWDRTLRFFGRHLG